MSKPKPRVKKSHYVPQAYLRQFANDDRLYVFDKAQRRHFGSHIKDVCSERDFYEIEGLEDVTGPDHAVEDLFHGFEDAGARVIRDTVETIREGAFTELLARCGCGTGNGQRPSAFAWAGKLRKSSSRAAQ